MKLNSMTDNSLNTTTVLRGRKTVHQPLEPEDHAGTRFRLLYAGVADELRQVEARFRRELDSPHQSLRPLLMHGTQLGGKRLRPALVLLAAKVCGSVTLDHIVLGTVIEMVHTATLVHDDVLDGADMRRHTPTINCRYDNHTSILLGDYLFAQSFRLAATLSSTRACQMIGEAARRVCEGELRQVLYRNDLALDESTYLQLLSDKTAELCSVACSLGAEYAAASEAKIAAFEAFGRFLGIAFQLADDYLDFWGDDQQIGKTLGTDLLQGKMTLPILRLLDQASPSQRQLLVSILQGPSEQRFQHLQPYLRRSDAESYTREMATRYQRLAIESLDGFDHSTSKDALISLAELAVTRI